MEVLSSKETHLGSAFLHPWDSVEIIKMPTNNVRLVFLWSGSLHHVRKEAGGFQLEKGMTWLLWCSFIGDYFLSSDTKVAVR